MPEGVEIQFYFESCPLTLQILLAERLNTTKLFPEDDLVALAKGLISVLAYFEELGIIHGDIDSSTIHFDAASGAFKLYDRDLQVGRNFGLT